MNVFVVYSKYKHKYSKQILNMSSALFFSIIFIFKYKISRYLKNVFVTVAEKYAMRVLNSLLHSVWNDMDSSFIGQTWENTLNCLSSNYLFSNISKENFLFSRFLDFFFACLYDQALQSKVCSTTSGIVFCFSFFFFQRRVS